MVVGLLLLGLTLGSPDLVRTGHRLFHDPGLGQSGASCATCHAPVIDEVADGDGLLRAGHPLGDVARRAFWWGDRARRRYASLAEALNVCPEVFLQRGPLAPWESRALVAYLESLSSRARRVRPAIQIITGLEADLDYNRPKYRGGHADRGRVLFYQACHGCHPHGRQGLGPDITHRTAAEVARQIREGNGMLRGVRKEGMWSPAFGMDRLSDEQVADLGAFVETLSRPMGEPDRSASIHGSDSP